MTPIIEKSVNGRNIFIYEVEIEYDLVKRGQLIAYEDDLKTGKAAEPPAVTFGAYKRFYDAPDVSTAINEASKKFEAFVQSQDMVIKRQTIRRCDLKFGGHAF